MCISHLMLRGQEVPWVMIYELSKEIENKHRLRPPSSLALPPAPGPRATEAAEQGITAKGLKGPPISSMAGEKPSPNLNLPFASGKSCKTPSEFGGWVASLPFVS